MSRGGRGGGPGGMMSRTRLTGGQALPMDMDPELIDACENSDPATDSDKELFPDITDFVMAAPITDAERREVQIYREHRAKMREGPFWTGTKEQWAEIDGKTGGNFNAFEDVASYGKKHVKKPWRMADLSKYKLDPRFHPKEVWPILGVGKDGLDATDDDETVDGRPAKKRKLGLSKKSTTDKLARFDEGYEEGQASDAEADGEADEEGSDAEKGDGEKDENGFDRELQDDDFDEDDDDADNDYNAELYFDGGEEDFEEQGGEDYGGDEG